MSHKITKNFEETKLLKERLDINTVYVCTYAKKILNTNVNISKSEYLHLLQKKLKTHKIILTTEEQEKLQSKKVDYFRHQYCGFASKSEYVKLIKNEHNNYNFKGSAVCGNVHRCPTCNQNIMRQRQIQLRALAKSHLKQGYKLGFVTLTQKTDSVKSTQDLFTQIKTNYRKFQNLKFYQKLKKSNFIMGQVVTTETTYNDHHNGHHHLHILYFYKTDFSKKIHDVQNELIQKWVDYTDANIKAQDQKVVNNINGITDYVAKWDVATEMTSDQHKNTSKGITFFQMGEALTILLQKSEHNPKTRETLKPIINGLKKLMSVHIEVTKGTRKMIISKSLLELYQVEDKTEQELAQEQETIEEIINFSRNVFVEICKLEIKAHILCICYEDICKTEKQLKIYQLLLEFRTELNLEVIENETYILLPEETEK